MLSLPAARKRHRYRGGRQSRDATGGSLARLHWLPHQDGCARPGCRCGCAHWTSSLSARSHSLTQRRFEENEERLEERDGACLGCRHAEAYGHREQGVGRARQRPRGRRQHRLARGWLSRCCCWSLGRVWPSAPPALPSARLLCPWGFPGVNAGVGCHSLLQPRGRTWASCAGTAEPAGRPYLTLGVSKIWIGLISEARFGWSVMLYSSWEMLMKNL